MAIHLTEQELSIAQKVARKVGSKWRTLDQADLEQHLCLWMCENIRHVERWREETGDGKLWVSLRREAGKYCSRETTQIVGQELHANNYYTTDRVARALPYLWEYHDWNTDNNTGGEAFAIMTDISNAYHGLPKQEQELLALRYRDGYTYDVIGAHTNITAEAARKRVGRSVQRLTDALDGGTLAWTNETRDAW